MSTRRNKKDTTKASDTAPEQENSTEVKSETASEEKTSQETKPEAKATASKEEKVATAKEEKTAKASSSKKEESSEPKPAADTTEKAAKPQKTGATWPGKLALALSFAALGASGYLYWMSTQQNIQNEQLRSEINAKVDSVISGARSDLSQNIASMNTKLGSIQSQATADKNNVNELQDRLTRSMQQLTAKQHNSRKDWLLAEVEYLLRLANQRILMENTASGALKLLKSADKILAETDDVTIYDVRKALASDIAALEAVPQLDQEGVFLKLGAMNRQVNDLRVTPISQQHQLPEMLKNVTPESVQESWTSGLQASWSKAVTKLESLVVIQHRDEPVEPLLSPDQKYYLQQNLHLMMEQAQLAILQRKQQAYDNALTKAEQWLTTYFEQADGTTQALTRGVNELKSVKVSPELPDISGSLNSLKSYLQEMTKLKQEGAA